METVMAMAVNKQELGRIGENYVAADLEKKGIAILERNFRCRRGEIDLIAQEGDQVIFIEVKARRGTGFGLPEESVGLAKQKRLRLVASFYLLQWQGCVPNCRFDVYSLMFDKEDRIVSLEVRKNCF